MFNKNYKIIIILVIFFITYFFYFLFLDKEILNILFMDIFFSIGIYFLLYSLNFLVNGNKVFGKIINYKFTSSDGDADGIKIKGIWYFFTFENKNDNLILKSDIKSKFKYKINDKVTLYFIEKVKKVALVQDIYIRLLFSCFILYLSISIMIKS